jgi:hypothetical protein
MRRRHRMLWRASESDADEDEHTGAFLRSRLTEKRRRSMREDAATGAAATTAVPPLLPPLLLPLLPSRSEEDSGLLISLSLSLFVSLRVSSCLFVSLLAPLSCNVRAGLIMVRATPLASPRPLLASSKLAAGNARAMHDTQECHRRRPTRIHAAATYVNVALICRPLIKLLLALPVP